jgi:predicted ATPase/class 3 adenylate cyclase
MGGAAGYLAGLGVKFMSYLNLLLERVQLTHYLQAFAARNLQFASLRSLPDATLLEMGIAAGHIPLLRVAAAEGEAGVWRKRPAERRQVSVLFCDLVGSTQLSVRMDPEDLRDVIERFREACTSPLLHFGGFIQRFVGDGILTLFGYPDAHEDDAERAVRAGLAVVAAVRRSAAASGGQELLVRIGIATGSVVVGDILEDALSEKSAVVGEAPNLAARLQSLAEPNGIVIDWETRQLAAEHFRYRRLDSIAIKGMSRGVAAYGVICERCQSRFAARGPAAAPLVGRRREMSLLRELWQRARAGAGQAALITGVAGIGKSRLIVGLSESIAGESAVPVQIWLQCSQFHGNAALNPFIRHFEQLAAMQPGDARTVRRVKLARAIGPAALAQEARRVLAELLAVDGAECPTAIEARDRRHRTLEAFEAWYAALAQHRPLLLVVEDIQWLDPSSGELLGRLIERAQHARMLIVASLRTPDAAADGAVAPEGATWLGRRHVSVCALAELGADEARQLLNVTCAGQVLASGVADIILQRSEGNPLYLEELTKTLLESQGADGTPADQLRGAMAVPAAISGLLLARLDRVGGAREAARQAAVIGREFDLDTLRAITTLPADQLAPAIAALRQADLIRPIASPGGDRYAFKHALLHDCAYHSLLKRTRYLLHGRLARHLAGDRLADGSITEDVIAEHHFRAGEHRAAADAFRHAAQTAAERSAQVEAANLCRKALACAEVLEETRERQKLRLAIILQLASALGSARGFAAAETTEQLSRARALCIALGERRHRCAVEFGLCISELVKGDLAGASARAQAMYPHAQRGGTAQLIDAHLANGMTRMQMGRFEEARALLEKAVALCNPRVDAPHLQTHGLNPGIYCRSYLAHVLAFLGNCDAALALIDDNLALARSRAADASHIYTYASALASAGRVYQLLRNAGDVAKVSQELVRLARQHHFDYFEAVGRIQQGWAIAHMGSLLGIRQMHDGLAALERTGSGLSVPGACVQLAELHVHLGEKTAAAEALSKAALREGGGSRIWDAEIARMRGEIALLSPETAPAAEQCFSQALRIARAQGARILELRVVAGYARLLQCLGRSAHALAMLERASRGMAPRRACRDLDGVRRLASTLRRASKRRRTDRLSPGSVRGRP